MEHENKDTLVRYLLGDLPEEDLERLAEEYFVRDEAWEALGAIESDLIDAYICGDLSPELQQKFTANFMNSPRRRERVEFAKTLMNSAVREQAGAGRIEGRKEEKWRAGPPPARPWFQRAPTRFAVAAVALVMASMIVAVAVQNGRLRNELQRMQYAQTELQHQVDIARQQAANRGTDTHGAKLETPLSQLLSHEIPTISIMLSPGVLRNSKNQSPKLPLTGVRSSIVLLLDLDQDQYAGYDAVVKTAGGKPIKRIKGLKSQRVQDNQKAVALSMPAQLLKRDDYVVTLFGRRTNGQVEPIHSYAFSVSR